MDERQPVLRADRQLLDQELEVVVARQRDDGAVRIGGAHAERGRQRPAERAGLAAIDPVARLVDMQELRAGDLAEPDRGDVGRVARQRLVHLLVDALRLQRHLVEMRLALHGLLAALPAFFGPARPVAQPARRLPLGGDVEQHLQRRTRIRDDAEIRREDAADLRRLDVDMDEFAARPCICRPSRCGGSPSGCRRRARSRRRAWSHCRSDARSAGRTCRPSADGRRGSCPSPSASG